MTPEPSSAARDGAAAYEPVRPCPRCGPVEWAIIRDCDHLAAECPRCHVSYDIGWSTRGYVA